MSLGGSIDKGRLLCFEGLGLRYGKPQQEKEGKGDTQFSVAHGLFRSRGLGFCRFLGALSRR